MPIPQCGQQCPLEQMSRWARRGQCYGRQGRSSSEARPLQESPVFLPVSRQWQERQCRKLRLPLVRTLALARHKPPPLLRNNEPCAVHEIRGDGNCLFRCLSLVITGSEGYHNLVRQRIVSHISGNCKAFAALLPESSETGNGQADACARYLSSSKMATGATWGSDVEILAAAHLLRTRIFVYTMHGPVWQWVEHGMELTEPGRKACRESIYLMHTGLVHYDLVEAVEQSPDASKELAPQPANLAHLDAKKQGREKDKPARPRGYSVPCARPDYQCGTRPRSTSRASRSSSGSVKSRSDSSNDSYSSCGESVACESVGNSVSYTSPSTAAYSRQRRPARPGALPSASRRKPFPASTAHTYNNNCLRTQTPGRGGASIPHCYLLPATRSRRPTGCRYSKRRSCKQRIAGENSL